MFPTHLHERFRERFDPIPGHPCHDLAASDVLGVLVLLSRAHTVRRHGHLGAMGWLLEVDDGG